MSRIKQVKGGQEARGVLLWARRARRVGLVFHLTYKCCKVSALLHLFPPLPKRFYICFSKTLSLSMASTRCETGNQEVTLTIKPDLVSHCNRSLYGSHIFHGPYTVKLISDSGGLQWLSGIGIMLKFQDLQTDKDTQTYKERHKYKGTSDSSYIIEPVPNDFFAIPPKL